MKSGCKKHAPNRMNMVRIPLYLLKTNYAQMNMDQTKMFTIELIALQSRLEKYAMSLTSDYDDAQDLVQETLLKALIHQNKFQKDTNLKAWVFTIMKNTFINTYHKTIMHETISNSADENQYLINRYPAQVASESDYLHRELYREINALDADFRIPFKMYAVGYKYKEIADRLNLKIGTVKSRIYLSKQKLIAALRD